MGDSNIGTVRVEQKSQNPNDQGSMVVRNATGRTDGKIDNQQFPLGASPSFLKPGTSVLTGNQGNQKESGKKDPFAFHITGTEGNDITDITAENFPGRVAVDMTQTGGKDGKGGKDRVNVHGTGLNAEINTADKEYDPVLFDSANHHVTVNSDPTDLVGFQQGVDQYHVTPVKGQDGTFLPNQWHVAPKDGQPGAKTDAGVTVNNAGTLAFAPNPQGRYSQKYNDLQLSQRLAQNEWRFENPDPAVLKNMAENPQIKSLYQNFTGDAAFNKHYQEQYQAHFGETARQAQGYDRQKQVQHFNAWLKGFVANSKAQGAKEIAPAEETPLGAPTLDVAIPPPSLLSR